MFAVPAVNRIPNGWAGAITAERGIGSPNFGNRSHFGMPQRVTSGINPRRISIILAVLERHGGHSLGDHDVFFNIAGGLTVAEPAIDLGIGAAILSSLRNRPLRRDIACLGELGLGGEIRPVNNMTGRLRELGRMGFKECVVSGSADEADWTKGHKGLALIRCRKIGDLDEVIFDSYAAKSVP